VDSLKQIERASNVTRINFGYEATPKGKISNLPSMLKFLEFS